ncbi:MAG: hypothetical protein WCO06_01520 [Candidatus Roizmanbacteria bacterium]
MAKTVSQLKDSVAGLLSGLDLQNVDSLYKAFERAARVFTQKAKIPETQGIQNIMIYDGVTDYLIDQSIFGTTLLDIRPQGISRQPSNFVFKKFGDDFDREKQYKSQSTVACFDYSAGVPIIRIISNYTPPQIVLDTMSDTTGWVASGSASLLASDSAIYYKKPASLRFTLTGSSTGVLTKTLTNSIDLTSYQGMGVKFLAIEIPTGAIATNLTNIEFRLGSDSSNYYTVTQTTGFLGSWVSGQWLLVAFDLSTASTTGSPVITAIDYLQVRIAHTGTFTNFRVGGLWISLPSQTQIVYGSAGFFKVGNTVLQTITTDNDSIILSDPAYAIYEYECALAVLQQTGGGASDSTMASFNSILNGLRARNGMVVQMGLYDLYRAENPSAELRTSGTYYSNDNNYF